MDWILYQMLMENNGRRESLFLGCSQSIVGGSHLNKWIWWSATKDAVEGFQCHGSADERMAEGRGGFYKMGNVSWLLRNKQELVRREGVSFQHWDRHVPVQSPGTFKALVAWRRVEHAYYRAWGAAMWIGQGGRLGPHRGRCQVKHLHFPQWAFIHSFTQHYLLMGLSCNRQCAKCWGFTWAKQALILMALIF